MSRRVYGCLSGIAAFLIVLVFAAVAFYAYDVWSDRRHSVTVLATAPMFAGNGNEECEGEQFTAVRPGVKLRVKRIRYWKNCATIDVVLENGNRGFVVLDPAKISIDPPLN